jgi:hypothetical protein
MSMDELLTLPSVTLPVTLVCAGNRRKEENMIKKSIGFNWGPCAVSTSYWTGGCSYWWRATPPRAALSWVWGWAW